MAEQLYRILYAEGKVGEAWAWERILVLVELGRRTSWPPRYRPALVFRDPEPVFGQTWEHAVREAILIARVEREQAYWSGVWAVMIGALIDAS